MTYLSTFTSFVFNVWGRYCARYFSPDLILMWCQGAMLFSWLFICKFHSVAQILIAYLGHRFKLTQHKSDNQSRL